MTVDGFTDGPYPEAPVSPVFPRFGRHETGMSQEKKAAEWFIWDAAAKKGRSIRVYGEFCQEELVIALILIVLGELLFCPVSNHVEFAAYYRLDGIGILSSIIF